MSSERRKTIWTNIATAVVTALVSSGATIQFGPKSQAADLSAYVLRDELSAYPRRDEVATKADVQGIEKRVADVSQDVREIRTILLEAARNVYRKNERDQQ